MSETLTTSEVLNRAADLIEERGWTCGGGWDDPALPGAPICLEGGIQAAAGLPFDAVNGAIEQCPAYIAVQRHLDYDWALYDWNDREDRTAAEVIEALRACAVIEASRERQAVTA